MRPAIAACLLLAASAPARADEVILLNGATLEGEVIEETEDSITLRMEGGRVTFERRLVSSIRKSPPPPAPAPPAEAPRPGAPAAPAPAAPAAASAPAAAVRVAAEDWCVLWSPERRVGWLHSQARLDAKGAAFEVSLSFLGADGRVEGTRRLVEETGPDLAPRSLFYMEGGQGRDLTRRIEVRGDRLAVESVLDGEKSSVDFPLPPDYGTPLAARARVLLDAASRDAGWSGTVYDPRAGRFERMSLRVLRREAVSRDGVAVDAVVLARERGGAVEEERVGPDGRVLSADLDGPRLTAVGTTKERIAAYRSGALPGEADEERRARTAFVSPEDGFRVIKPGASWVFLPAEGPGDGRRVLVRDALGVVSASVESRVLAAGEDPPPAALGAAILESLGASLPEFRRTGDGFVEHAGRPAFRLEGEAVVDGDPVRLLVLAFAHRGRAWTLTATAPRAHWKEARPYLEGILSSFEWL